MAFHCGESLRAGMALDSMHSGVRLPSSLAFLHNAITQAASQDALSFVAVPAGHVEGSVEGALHPALLQLYGAAFDLHNHELQPNKPGASHQTPPGSSEWRQGSMQPPDQQHVPVGDIPPHALKKRRLSDSLDSTPGTPLGHSLAGQPQETFWQTAWQHINFYLGDQQQHQQPVVVAESHPPPRELLSREERQALSQILECVQQAKLIQVQQQIAHLQAMAAPLASIALASDAATGINQDAVQAGGEGMKMAARAIQQNRLTSPAHNENDSRTKVPQVAAAASDGVGLTTAKAAAGTALGRGFSLRSPKYVGVYKSRRMEEGWRAQFAFGNKVINLGTFPQPEEAARVWNEAALLLRGDRAWLNPVEPRVRPGHQQGELLLTSQRAVLAIRAAAEASGAAEVIVAGIKFVV